MWQSDRMIFSVLVEVQLRPGVADPQGSTIERSLPALGFGGVVGVRVGKAMRFTLDSADAAALQQAHEGDNAIRLNLGRIEGGTKANMIASSCVVRLGVRPHASMDPSEVLERLFALAGPTTTQQIGFLASALPARRSDRSVVQARAQALQMATSLDLAVGLDVDFFTEAAFFSAAGADVVVFGPGDIAQAHTAGEWVALSQLDAVVGSYSRVLAGVRL